MHSRGFESLPQDREIRAPCGSDQSTKRIARKSLQFASCDEIRVSKCLKITQTEEEEEEAVKEEIAVSALLMLASQDPWTIKKKLTQSDIHSSSRLLISTKLVQEHILPYLSRQEIESEKGLNVSVRDCDTGHVIELKFKWWHSSKSYIFNEGWKPGFVNRRDLQQDDEIGLFWNPIDNMLIFSVLHRAPVRKSV